LDNVCYVPERLQCVLVDVGAGCQFDDADMLDSELAGGTLLERAFLEAHLLSLRQAHRIWYLPSLSSD
jgi:hypothetical protein